MKICIVSGIFHPEIGGPATHLHNLCFELVERGYGIYVVTYGDVKEDYRYPFFIKRISRKDFLLLRLLKFTYQVIKIGKNCDIFYVDNYGFPVALANLILRKPIVIRIAGDFAWEYAYRHSLTSLDIDKFQNKKHSLSVAFIKEVQYFYTKAADKVVVPSNYLKSIVGGWGIPSKKIDIVYNASREEDFRISISQAEAKRELGINSKIILTVARLVPWKGIDMLIKILPRFNKEIQLVVVGDGPDMQRLKDLAHTTGVEKRVIFRGQIPHNKVISLYLKAADVFVLPSSYEGLPHTILEAMTVGIPIVATNLGGIPEVIEDSKEGLLFKPGDLSSLEDSISRLLEDRDTALKFVENAKEKVKQFNWDTLREKIIWILDSVINNRQRNCGFE